MLTAAAGWGSPTEPMVAEDDGAALTSVKREGPATSWPKEVSERYERIEVLGEFGHAAAPGYCRFANGCCCATIDV